MQIDVITIFPKMFGAVLGESMLKRGQEKGLLRIKTHDLRKFTHDQRRTVDDRPYGGGPGMIMKPEPIFKAVEEVQAKGSRRGGKTLPQSCEIVLMSPSGEMLSTKLAGRLARLKQIIIICGHYEGIDERVKSIVDRSVSIGDYVLTGGELPAMVLMDCVARYIPGVIGHEHATNEESFACGLLEYPQYTRPATFRGMEVPEVLLTGNHRRIGKWRKLQSVAKTARLRPDLIDVCGAANKTVTFGKARGT